VQNRRAQAARIEQEGKDMLTKLQKNYDNLDYIADDFKVDTNLRKAGIVLT